jgi:gamma-tubulin complex component 2
VEVIEKAYAFASHILLDLLLNEYDLMRRLQSVKHYLLMDQVSKNSRTFTRTQKNWKLIAMQLTIIVCNALQGDFIVQFLDLTENELRKQVDDLNPVRLESLLELALRTSSSTTDPYKDSVKVELFAYGIREQMLSIMRIETPLEDHKVRIYYFLTRS